MSTTRYCCFHTRLLEIARTVNIQKSLVAIAELRGCVGAKCRRTCCELSQSQRGNARMSVRITRSDTGELMLNHGDQYAQENHPIVIVPATILLGAHSSFGESTAVCKPEPGASVPKGSHWYYRVDRLSHRHCWYLGAAGLRVLPPA